MEAIIVELGDLYPALSASIIREVFRKWEYERNEMTERLKFYARSKTRDEYQGWLEGLLESMKASASYEEDLRLVISPRVSPGMCRWTAARIVEGMRAFLGSEDFTEEQRRRLEEGVRELERRGA